MLALNQNICRIYCGDVVHIRHPFVHVDDDVVFSVETNMPLQSKSTTTKKKNIIFFHWAGGSSKIEITILRGWMSMSIVHVSCCMRLHNILVVVKRKRWAFVWFYGSQERRRRYRPIESRNRSKWYIDLVEREGSTMAVRQFHLTFFSVYCIIPRLNVMAWIGKQAVKGRSTQQQKKKDQHRIRIDTYPKHICCRFWLRSTRKTHTQHKHRGWKGTARCWYCVLHLLPSSTCASHIMSTINLQLFPLHTIRQSLILLLELLYSVRFLLLVCVLVLVVPRRITQTEIAFTPMSRCRDDESSLWLALWRGRMSSILQRQLLWLCTVLGWWWCETSSQVNRT